MNIRAFVYKETLHVLRDWRMMLVVILIPVVQMLLFGFAISTEVNNINVAVAYDRLNESVRQTTERISANPYVTMKGCVTIPAIHETLRSGAADAVALFRDGGEAQIVTDASNPNMAQTGAAYLRSIISNQKAASLAATHFLYNPQLRSSYNFVPGIMGMLFMLICALMTAVSIVREKETGTMELLLVSPVKPVEIIISKMTPFFALSCADLALILLIAKHLLGVPMTAGIMPIICVTLIYIVLSLALGLLVSTLANSQVTAMLLCGMVMLIPVIMLSGLIFPTDNLPIILKQISYIVPARWYIDAMRKMMIEGLSVADVIYDVAILTCMAILLIIVSIRNFKDRLQ